MAQACLEPMDSEGVSSFRRSTRPANCKATIWHSSRRAAALESFYDPCVILNRRMEKAHTSLEKQCLYVGELPYARHWPPGGHVSLGTVIVP